MKTLLMLAAIGLAGAVVALAGAPLPPAYKLLYEQNFEHADALKEFVFSDPAAWRLGKDVQDRPCLELFGKSKYNPKHRSPFNIALVNGKVFGDFILEAELQSTVKPYNHQDLCLFFGFQATNRFYYCHLAVRPDPNAHNLFIVNDAPRTNFAAQVSNGVVWENTWHKVRLERQGADIKVFFDDSPAPAMTGRNAVFAKGFLGFGSFDDMGKFRRIKVYGPSAEEQKANFFKTIP